MTHIYQTLKVSSMNYTVDKKIMSERFRRSAETYHKEAFVQRQIAQHLCELVRPYVPKPVSLLEIGCGTGFLTQEIMQHLPICSALLNDINPEMEPFIHRFLSEQKKFIAADAETYPFNDNFNLIISSSAIQWFNNIKKFIFNVYSSLTKKGIIAFSTFGTKNMKEIKKITGISLPYPDIRVYLKPYFRILHYEEQIFKVQFETPLSVLQHLKNTGVNGIQKTYWSIKQINSFKEEYGKLYKTEVGVSLTYHPIYIVAIKK